MIESKRALVLSLLSETFHVFNMRVSLEGGAKTGALKFVFPVLACEQDNSSDHIEDASDVEEFQREIRQAPALADAVLARLNISYAELIALSVGDVLELPADCIHNLSLEMSGQVVLSKGTLGQVNGLRAAKVWVPSSQDTPQTHTFDPVAERLQTPDDAILKETEVFLPPVEAVENELVLEQMQEAGSDPGVDDGIEDFSDLDDLDNYEPQVPQAVA
jgi:flagellar motor switch protein FliM